MATRQDAEDIYLAVKQSLTSNQAIDLVLERLQAREKRLQEILLDNSLTEEGDINEPINDQFPEVSGLEAAYKWALKLKDECAREGTSIDTGFRCVSEGGEIFYFSPEELLTLFEDKNKAEKAIQEALKIPGVGNPVNNIRNILLAALPHKEGEGN